MATRKTTRKRSTRKRSTRKRSTKTTKDLEAKIAQLEGKLSQLSAQAGQKPAEAKPTPPPPPPPKPAEAPKPAPQAKAPPRTLESVIESVPMGNWIMQKTKTPAYVCENPRAWARRHPDVGPVPTTSWILQKSKITGYTAPSNQYFANKQRLAYKNPATSFTGYGVSLGYGGTKTVPPPKTQTQGSLPKGF